MTEKKDDSFELYDLKVTVEGDNFVCHHHVGQGFWWKVKTWSSLKGDAFRCMHSLPFCHSSLPKSVPRIRTTG